MVPTSKEACSNAHSTFDESPIHIVDIVVVVYPCVTHGKHNRHMVLRAQEHHVLKTGTTRASAPQVHLDVGGYTLVTPCKALAINAFRAPIRVVHRKWVRRVSVKILRHIGGVREATCTTGIYVYFMSVKRVVTRVKPSIPLRDTRKWKLCKRFVGTWSVRKRIRQSPRRCPPVAAAAAHRRIGDKTHHGSPLMYQPHMRTWRIQTYVTPEYFVMVYNLISGQPVGLAFLAYS